MINYIRHDEQFFAALKLNTGEEVLGEVLIGEDPDTKKDMIFIQNPAKTRLLSCQIRMMRVPGIIKLLWD